MTRDWLRWSWAAWGWRVLYLGMVTAGLFWALHGWGYDDPYITYRYAANLASGLGFVFNPGERVLSTTTPFFTLFLALIAKLGLDIPRLANLSGIVCLAGSGLLLWELGQLNRSPFLAWSGLFIFPILPQVASTVSSETPVYIFLCLAALVAYLKGRLGWAAFAAGLAFLTRPDGIIVAGILCVHWLVTRRRLFPWKPAALFLLLTLPWLVFAWLYFGSPLPVTLYAKHAQGLMPISTRFAAGLVPFLTQYANRPFYLLVGLFSIPGLAAIVRGRNPATLVPLWSAVYVLAYSLLGVSRYFWYYAPLIPGLLVAFGLGLQVMVDAFARRFDTASHWAQLLGGIAVLIIILVGAGAVLDIRQIHFNPDPRLAVYRQVGEWFRSNTPPDASVGMLETGIIGYYSQRPVIDFAGLIQPAVATHMSSKSDYGITAAWAIQQYHPVYLILNRGVFPSIEQGYASQGCRLVQSFPYKTAPLDVYHCENPWKP